MMYFHQWRKSQELRESVIGIKEIVNKFIPFIKKFLKLKNHPEIHFLLDGSFAKKIAAFGEISKNDIIKIDIKDRHPMDVLRTLAHELVHYQQHEHNGENNKKVKSKLENEANQLAGIVLKKFGEAHPEYFELSSIDEEKKKKKRKISSDIDYEHYPVELV